ncbi:Putative lipoprotein [Streptomyces venezuelae]|uniref:hypothetical protein n=1 Tax=Streptomyces gardneri TaxID=66892 RepID=UPI0006BC35DF|nr:hypothetical protein [Streptomyces gardneri]ALO09973.1 Putative lipoprotein [Streptomyces venezuelae]QPK47014.1 DUF461 domain-containing protein [Streptomyces gardneri]WRK38430.1 DUF461 domain-containing protein [Streptomyces venezuelae]CUM39582.1 putative lipoprotein [Streptomyces venezuelae]
MSRSLRRGALAATAIVFSIAALSACGAGNDAQTLQVKPDNAAVTVDDVKIQNALVITQPHRGVKGPAVVSATVFNNGRTPQTLDAITLPGTSATVKLTAAAGATGPITVPPLGSVVIGGEGNATATIENGTAAARNGDAQKVVFKLSKTGEVGLDAFVVPATSYFTEFGPSIVPAPPGSETTAPAPAEGEHGGEHGAEPSGEATTAGH